MSVHDESEIEGGEVVGLEPAIPGVTVKVNARVAKIDRPGVMIKVTGGTLRRVYQITCRAQQNPDTGSFFTRSYDSSGGRKRYGERAVKSGPVQGPFKWNQWFHDQILQDVKKQGIWAPVSDKGGALIFFDAPSFAGRYASEAPACNHYFIALTYIVVDNGLIGIVKWRTKTSDPTNPVYTAGSMQLTAELVDLARATFERHGRDKAGLRSTEMGFDNQALGIPNFRKLYPETDSQLASLSLPSAAINKSG